MTKGEYIRYSLLVLLSALLISWPLYSDVVIANFMLGDDFLFHLNRIEGIKEGILSGQFPVRVHAYQLDGHGYLTGIFYPDFWLYFPAFLRLVGVPIGLAYNLWLILVNIGAAFLAWYGYTLFTRSPQIGAYSAIVYELAMYRGINLYERGAIGEVLAVAFLPLLLAAVYEILYRRAERWPLAVLAACGIFFAHLLSTILASMLVFVIIVVSWRQLRERERRIALCKAVAVTGLLNLWFVIPFMETYTHMDFNMTHYANLFLSYGWPFSLLFIKGFTLGLVMVLGLGALGLGWRNLTGDIKSYLCPCILIGGFFLLISLEFFPWQEFYKIGFIKAFIGLLQFPWRFLTYAEVFLSLAAGVGFYLLSQRGSRKFFLVMFLITLIMCNGLTQLAFDQRREGAIEMNAMWPLAIKDDLPSMGVAVGGMFDYLYHGFDDYVAEVMGKKVETPENVNMQACSKQGTNVNFTYNSPTETTARVALIYYPGYEAVLEDGTKLELGEDEYHLLTVKLPDGEHQVSVSYVTKGLWRAGDIISLLTAVAFGRYCWRRRREIWLNSGQQGKGEGDGYGTAHKEPV